MNTHVRIDRPSAKARFTTGEFLRMVEVGAFDDMKVELVDGEIERMPPPMSNHASRQAMTIALLWQATKGADVHVFGEIGIDLGGDSVMACDAALATASPTANRLLSPDEIVLAVEVSETTLGRDLGLKRDKYGTAGVANYWVVDNANAVTHVHGDLTDGKYGLIDTVRFDVSLAVPGTDATVTFA